MGKVFVLALDALEYNLIVNWKMKNLMQKRYGKIKLGLKYYRSKINAPFTPIVWASFITGLSPERHKIKDLLTYGKKLDYIRKLPVISWLHGKRRILRKFGFNPRTVDERDLETNTLFNKIQPFVAVDVPSWNELRSFYRLSQAFRRGLKEYEKEIWKIYEERKQKVFENLSKRWRLFMAYFQIADLIGHIYFGKKLKKLHEVYKTLDVLAFDIKSLLPNDTIFLIVSDHGMKLSEDGLTGNHSDHAFWSINIKTEWTPRDITDFYLKITEWAS
jgi:predicted AlkP superfamily phosphohydrolase/phosphomutase